MSRSLYIIDGHAQIYAAYYAPISSSLTSPTGEPTKAAYIFTTMLLKLLKDRKPDMLLVAMDAPGKTFRHEMYDQYKANRPPMPDDLPSQIDRIDQILTAMNIQVIRVPGFEADDIIAAMTQKAEKENYDIFICSKDKDLEQLISDRTVLYDPIKDSVTNLTTLLKDKGIRPDQVVDVLALAGDTVDNIPGVPLVGPGSAQKWIQKYGSLENLMTHKDELKGKRGDNLRANIDQLDLSRQLVTLNYDVPIKLDLPDLAIKAPDKDALADIYRTLGFHRLLEQMGIDTAPPEKPVIEPQTSTEPEQYRLVDTEETFDDFFAKLSQQKSFAIDTETTNINPVKANLVGLSFSWHSRQGYYLPVMAPLGQKHLDWNLIKDKLAKVLCDADVKKTGQNIKYDLIVLRKAGIDIKGVAFDTMVASYVLNSDRMRHNMDSMAMDYLGHETIKLSSLLGKGKNQITFDLVDTAMAADYAAEDADITWRLAEFIDNNLTDKELRNLFTEVEMPLVEVLADMEYNGIALDVPWLKKLSNKISNRMELLTEQIYKESESIFNVDSPKQLAAVLFEKLGLKTGKKNKSGYSTDQEVLESLRWDHPVPPLVLEYRQLSKLKNTYTDKLPSMICHGTGRVHCSFNQTITATGRLSSSDPNLQNIPVRSELGQQIRKAFVPQSDDNVILAADYSQVELRMLAHLSGDEHLLAAFSAGQDIHRSVAAQVFDIPINTVDSSQRGKAKAVNFGIIYGQSAFGLSKSIGISQRDAQQFIDDYFQRYPAIRSYMDRVISDAKKNGYVKTIMGRRRKLPDINSRAVAKRRLAERMAVNTVVQGSAADLIKVAMINLHRQIQREKLDMKMMLQVHDELVFEMPELHVEQYVTIIEKTMTSAISLDVPLMVDVGWGRNWLECK